MVEKFLHFHGIAAYAVIFALPALESSVFLGFVFPGEIAVILGGVLASQGSIGLGWAMGAAFAGAVVGDSVGYEVGRHWGNRLLDGPLRRFVKPHHRERASAFLRRHGGKAVFLGRFVAAMRVLVPGLAGIAEMRYGTFLLFNVLGGAAWAAGMTLAGYGAGAGYKRIEHLLGRASLILLVIVVLVVAVTWTARWVARHPERVQAWAARQRRKPVLRQIFAVGAFLAARFRPGQAFGLGLTLGAVTIIVIATTFGTILHDVASRQELVHIDDPVLNAMIRHTEAGFTRWMKVVSVLGSAPFALAVAAISAAALAVRKRWRWALILGVTPVGAWGLENLVKLIVARPRPPVHALAHATGYSFPSGHATLAVALYGAFALVAARAWRGWPAKVSTWTGAIMLACLVGFSRIYLRVHYLTDVLGGLTLGLAWLAVVGTAEGAWERRTAVRG